MVNEENVGLLDINEISMKSEEIAEKNRIRFCLSNIPTNDRANEITLNSEIEIAGIINS